MDKENRDEMVKESTGVRSLRPLGRHRNQRHSFLVSLPGRR
jgi:hypothetical protein